MGEVAAAAVDPLPLETSKVSTSYGKAQVFKDVSISVRSDEAFGLIGLNGAGKTTLIRSILGLRGATGHITLFGEPNTVPFSRRRLIYLPEKFQPSPQVTGFEHLSILLDYFGQRLDKAQARKEASSLDLDPSVLSKKVKTYSKGMGQKLGLVGTFLVDAPLMILDEPMSGLDPRARVHLKDRLGEAKKSGRSIFFSSHILADIEEICDRIGVLHDGEIIFDGTPEHFIAQYGAPSLERAFLSAIKSPSTPHT